MKVTAVLPPRKRDWKPGTTQLGLFIRFPDGAVIEVSVHEAKTDESEAAHTLLGLLSRSLAARQESK